MEVSRWDEILFVWTLLGGAVGIVVAVCVMIWALDKYFHGGER